MQTIEAQHSQITSDNYSPIKSQNLDSRVQADVEKYQATNHNGQDSGRDYADVKEVRDKIGKHDTKTGISLNYREATAANNDSMRDISNALNNGLDLKIDGGGVSSPTNYTHAKPESENKGSAKEGTYKQDKARTSVESGEDAHNVKSNSYESRNSGKTESHKVKAKEGYSIQAESRESSGENYRRGTADSDSKVKSKETSVKSEGLERQVKVYTSSNASIAHELTASVTNNYQSNSRQNENDNSTNYSGNSGLERQVNSAQAMHYHRLMQNVPDDNPLSIRFAYDSYRKKEDDLYRSDSKNSAYSSHNRETQTKGEKKEEEESTAKKKFGRNAKTKNKRIQAKQDKKEVKKIAKKKQNRKKRPKLKIINGDIKNGSNIGTNKSRSNRKEINWNRVSRPVMESSIAA